LKAFHKYKFTVSSSSKQIVWNHLPHFKIVFVVKKSAFSGVFSTNVSLRTTYDVILGDECNFSSWQCC